MQFNKNMIVMLVIATAIGLTVNGIVSGWFVEKLSHNDAPAWVQGIGSVVAVFAAAMTTFWQEKKKQRADAVATAIQAKALAIAVLPAYIELRGHLAKVKQRLAEIEEQKLDSRLNEYQGVLDALRFDMHPSILRNIDRLYLIGWPLVEAIGVVGNIVRIPNFVAHNPRFKLSTLVRYMRMLEYAEDQAYSDIQKHYYFGETEKLEAQELND
jgi:hypothetical protein